MPPFLLYDENGSDKEEQYAAYNDNRGGHLCRAFVFGKVKNQYALLGTLAKSRADTSPEAARALLAAREELGAQAIQIASTKESPPSNVRGALMGLEGNCSRVYWEALSQIIPPAFGFPGRSGRYAQDPINAMLNYGYAMLEGEVWHAVHYAGLDPYGGFLHVDRPGKASMVLDLMEEFRQQTVDRTIISMVTHGMVKGEDFAIEEGICRLGDRAKRLLVGSIESLFEECVRHRDIKVRWTDLIMSQAVEVAKYLRGSLRLMSLSTSGGEPVQPMVSVSDVVQYFYCPRKIYYLKVLGVPFKVKRKMEVGREEDEKEESRLGERKTVYGIDRGEVEQVLHNLYLEDSRVGLAGQVDTVLRLRSGEHIPVDSKYTEEVAVHRHYRKQLVAYSVLLESAFGTAVSRGILLHEAEGARCSRHLG